MSARWTRAALSDLATIHVHIAADSAVAANALSDQAIEFVETTLTVQPGIGRPGRVEGTREAVVHPNYVMVYRVKERAVEILDVRHLARRWPVSF
jgi:toxin ParE1/3/4